MFQLPEGVDVMQGHASSTGIGMGPGQGQGQYYHGSVRAPYGTHNQQLGFRPHAAPLSAYGNSLVRGVGVSSGNRHTGLKSWMTLELFS